MSGRKCFVTLRVPRRLTSTCLCTCAHVCQSNSPHTHTPALLIRAYRPETGEEKRERGRKTRYVKQQRDLDLTCFFATTAATAAATTATT